MPRIQYTLEQRRQIVQQMIAQFTADGYLKGLDSLPAPEGPPSLEKVDLSNKQMAQINFNPITKGVLCGTIFGDSSLQINQGYANARVQNRHSSRQSDWFLWKWLVPLAQFNNGASSIVFQNSDGYQADAVPEEGEILGKLKIATKVDEKLTALIPLLKPQGFKKFERSWLNHMNNYFLMTLWLDDGSLFNGTQGVFCLESFTEEQQQVFRKYMKSVWSVNLTFRPASETDKHRAVRMLQNIPQPLRLHFTTSGDLQKFLLIIAPIVPVESMLYKLYFNPSNNMSELQRWASELESKVNPRFKVTVNAYYSNIIKQSQTGA